jgi:hypothetical protein
MPVMMPALAQIVGAITGMLWQRLQLTASVRHEVITEFYPMLLAAIAPTRQHED